LNRNWRNERTVVVREQEFRSRGGFVFLLVRRVEVAE
jgi:hypothetical protein